jgi:hypothetical protein
MYIRIYEREQLVLGCCDGSCNTHIPHKLVRLQVVKEGSPVLTKLSRLVRIVTTAQCRARQQSTARARSRRRRRRRNMASTRCAAVARSGKGQNLENCHPWQLPVSFLSAATRSTGVDSICCRYLCLKSRQDSIPLPLYRNANKVYRRSKAQLARGVIECGSGL